MSHYLHFYEISDMKLIFQQNSNAEYSTKELKGGYTSNGFFVLNVYLNEKGTFAKIQFLKISILKDHHIKAQSGPQRQVMMNDRYLFHFGQNFTMNMVNVGLN